MECGREITSFKREEQLDEQMRDFISRNSDAFNMTYDDHCKAVRKEYERLKEEFRSQVSQAPTDVSELRQRRKEVLAAIDEFNKNLQRPAEPDNPRFRHLLARQAERRVDEIQHQRIVFAIFVILISFWAIPFFMSSQPTHSS